MEQAAVDKGALPADREHQEEEDMEVEKAPEPKKDVVVEKQRAIVKPHILTHVIEGFIIQEGPEPFPVCTYSTVCWLSLTLTNRVCLVISFNFFL